MNTIRSPWHTDGWPTLHIGCRCGDLLYSNPPTRLPSCVWVRFPSSIYPHLLCKRDSEPDVSRSSPPILSCLPNPTSRSLQDGDHAHAYTIHLAIKIYWLDGCPLSCQLGRARCLFLSYRSGTHVGGLGVGLHISSCSIFD